MLISLGVIKNLPKPKEIAYLATEKEEIFLCSYSFVSLVAQTVKRQPATWVGKIPWRRKWHPLQYSCLENSMDGGTWWDTVHGVAKSRTRLSDFTFL